MDMKKTKAVCPKCRSKNIAIIETCEHSQVWDQNGGIIDLDEGYKEPGDVVSTHGSCDCGHKWKFRTLQITDLIIE